MNSQNHLIHTIILLLVTISLLAGYSMAYKHIPFFQESEPVRNIVFFEGLFSDPSEEVLEDTTSTIAVVEDSSGVSYEIDSLAYVGVSHLQHFFVALDETKRKKGTARVAYYGDSMIEGDLISQTLRQLLQERFGGENVGFVPITSITSGFRRTVTHSFSKKWRDYSFLKAAKKPFYFGISGEYFLSPRGETNLWLSYKSGSRYESGDKKPFQRIRLFYGRIPKGAYIPEKPAPVQADTLQATSPKPDSIASDSMQQDDTLAHNKPASDSLQDDTLIPEPPKPSIQVRNSFLSIQTDQGSEQFKLTGEAMVNQLVLNMDSTERIRLNFRASDSLPIFGMSFDLTYGAYVDNFSSRGNSGMSLTSLDPQMLKEFQQYLDYDLIVLQFGLNVFNPRMKNYDWYAKAMKRVIVHLKAALPNTSILVVSAGDKGLKRNGTIITDPSMPRIVEAQRRAAIETGAAFFNLFEAMGGEGSMVEWVNAKPRLANRDYTHLSFEGAELVGTDIYDFLMEAYQQYQAMGLPQNKLQQHKLDYQGKVKVLEQNEGGE